MNLPSVIRNYLHQPFPLWETDITGLLINEKWTQLAIDTGNYSIPNCINDQDEKVFVEHVFIENGNNPIVLEFPSICLADYYNSHGLNPLSSLEIENTNAKLKVKAALDVLHSFSPVEAFVSKLVRSMQILRPEYYDTDISYSHPKIPFSIFFSVCEDQSDISNFRVIESIIHEAMHLKLTLIEENVQLVKFDTGNLFYSPWRQENRPARGVLHGLFVFRALLDFFTMLSGHPAFQEEAIYLTNRIQEIMMEINQLKGFENCPDLTVEGAILTKNLLP